MCTLKSPMSQLLSNKSVKVFSHQNGEGGEGGGGTLPPKNFCSAGREGGVRPPCSPLLRSL